LQFERPTRVDVVHIVFTFIAVSSFLGHRHPHRRNFELACMVSMMLQIERKHSDFWGSSIQSSSRLTSGLEWNVYANSKASEGVSKHLQVSAHLHYDNTRIPEYALVYIEHL